jgi:hypothetical protein
VFLTGLVLLCVSFVEQVVELVALIPEPPVTLQPIGGIPESLRLEPARAAIDA